MKFIESLPEVTLHRNGAGIVREITIGGQKIEQIRHAEIVMRPGEITIIRLEIHAGRITDTIL